MKLAIKGHATRGKEIIQLLEMLGGVNKHQIDAIRQTYVYFIDIDGVIRLLQIGQLLPEQYIVYSLEEFEEKFPHKVGDKVQHKGATSCGSIFDVESMLWEKDTVKYTLCLFGCNYKRSTLPAEYLQPYKEETMEERGDEPKAPILSNRYDYAEGKCGYVIPDGYEFDSIEQGFQTEIIIRPIKPQYPKTYAECCRILNHNVNNDIVAGYKDGLLENIQKLLICRDAYWKIAGKEMGLGKSWEPDWVKNANTKMYTVYNTGVEVTKLDGTLFKNYALVFPTVEMRDAFYENFKVLINECKELL